jgi:hypothetical protein
MSNRSSRETEENSVESESVPELPSWISRQLIEHTLRVWQPFYDAPLTHRDALEIITNVSGLMDVLQSGVGYETVRCFRSGEQS